MFKKISTSLLSFIMAFVLVMSSFSIKGDVYADEEEMRAAWICTVFNIDWPSQKGLSVNNQKNEYIKMLEGLKDAGINTVIVQVRSEGDAFYKSEINPWSRFLTGTQGKDPGYDPLAFIVSETHKRGMKVHAWFNPFRASIYNNTDNISSKNVIKKHPEWVVNYSGKWYLNPGIPEVRNYVVQTVAEVVENYDIDGVHFDDYFYPGSGFPDQATYDKYGNGENKNNWRRENVNKLLDSVHKKVKEIDSNVDFGVSPGGIWRNKSSISSGSNTGGNETYSNAYADTRAWIQRGLVDYVVPQVYWKIGHPVADYKTLISWWAKEVENTDVKLYIGQGIYKHGQNEYGGENVAKEIKQQIQFNRKFKEVKGSMYFSAKDILNNSQVKNDLKSLYIKQNIIYPYRSQLIGTDRTDTAVKISKIGWKDGANTVVLAAGEDEVEALSATPLAASKNAPILLTFVGKLYEDTKQELKRLNPSNIIIVGNEKKVSKNIENELKQTLSNVNISRYGEDTEEKTSLEISKQVVENNNSDKIYIASTNAAADILSIASKAGQEKNPILMVNKNNISKEQLDFIIKTKIKDIYFIGGPDSLDNSIINKLSDSVDKNLSNNRVYGLNRNETNGKVIEKFYTENEYRNAFVTNDYKIIDAITVASMAAKRGGSPIILAGEQLSEKQTKIVDYKFVSLMYQVGGGVHSSVYQKIYNLLAKKSK